MIEYVEDGNIFESQADALVNPVNCDGYMGKGLALEFKKRFPEYFLPYKRACAAKKLKPGLLLFVQLTIQPELVPQPPGVIMFPTKDHWKGRSRLEWIEQGLSNLQEHYKQWGLASIAMPQIGAGLGGLKWEDVQPLIERYFRQEPVHLDVYVRGQEEEIPKQKPAESENKQVIGEEQTKFT
jgi:O-acetyl-ADP-ribose deacetylase (regulator of RNase III)